MLSDLDFKRENGNGLVIAPWEERLASPVGYDLRLGLFYKIHNEKKEGCFFHKDDHSAILEPNELAIVKTLEFVWLSAAFGATCHIKGSWGSKGLILCNASTIDPNWSGDLVFVIKNCGIFPLEIKYGDPLLTMTTFAFQTPTQTEQDTRVGGVISFYAGLGLKGIAETQALYDESRYSQKREFDREVARARQRLAR